MNQAISAFNGGEVSPLLAGRVDLEGLRRSCRIMRNFIPGVTGGAFRRPPLLHAGMALPFGSRLIPFNFSTGVSYQLEVAENALRIWLSDGTGEPVTLEAPWTFGQIHALHYVQSNDVMWLVHPQVPVHELRRTVDGWELAPVPWAWPPLRDENTGAITLTPSATTGTITLTASAALFDALHAGAFWQVSHFREETAAELTVPIIPPASAVLSFTVQPITGETFSIGGTVYTWRAATAVSGPCDVAIGTDFEGSRNNAMAAINAAGEGFGPGTARHPQVQAEDGGQVDTGTAATGRLSGPGTNNILDLVVEVGAMKYRFEGGSLGVSGDEYDVLRGATLAESLQNLVKAVNLTGVAGTDYAAGMIVNPDATAAMDGMTAVIFTAKVSGTGGNSVATTTPGRSELDFGAITLTGGATGAAYKLKAVARKAGAAGNAITLADTMGTDGWNTATLTGGASSDAVSDPVEIKGAWNFTTYGRWEGAVYIEQQNTAGLWEIVRKFTGRLDVNRTAAGVNDTKTAMRIRVADMTGMEASDVPEPRFVLEAAEGLAHGLVQITAVDSATVAQATVVSVLHSVTATPIWREGAFSAYRGYPGTVALHEQRLIFGGNAAEPQKLWASVAGDFRNFEETGFDDGSWQYSFSSPQANPVCWLLSARGLVIGTSGEERVWDSGDAGITPNHPPVQRPMTFNGSEPVQPVGAGGAVIFVQRGGRALLEYSYEQATDSYITPDLAQLVEHLTAYGIRAVALQRSPWPVLWVVTLDGQLLACTYARREEVVAWAPQPAGGTVESVSVVYGSQGQADEVWIVVTRAAARRLERFDPGHWERLHTGGRLYHMDAAARRYTPGGGMIGGVASGLDHLEGMAVKVIGSSGELPDQTVIGGTVTVMGESDIVVGLAQPEAQLQPALFDFLTDTGTSQGRKFHTPELTVRFYKTRECRYADGPEAEAYDVTFRDAEDPADAPPPLFTGLKRLQCRADFRDGVDVTLSADGIHPLNVLCMVPRFQAYG